jgi:hypothetical protein
MSKKILTVLSITSGITLAQPLQANICIDNRSSIGMNQETLSDEKKALLYLSCAYSNLVSKDYDSALGDYQKSLDALARSGSPNPGMEFLISFGMAVACDHLHLMHDAQQHILHLHNLLEDPEEIDDDS